MCVKIVIPRVFQNADGAMFFVTLSCVCKALGFFLFYAVLCEISAYFVRSVSRDV